MNARAIIASATERGIVLSADAGRIRHEGPKGALTPDLVDAIRDHRAEVLALLEAEVEARVEEPPLSALQIMEAAPGAGPTTDQDRETAIALRVAAFADQANRPGLLPLLTLPGVPADVGADRCLSCGGLLDGGSYRCPVCAEAVRRALSGRPRHRAQDASGAPPGVRRSVCPSCGQGGLWRRVAALDDVRCVRCGAACAPSGPGPPPEARSLPHHDHEEDRHDGTQAPGLPGPGVHSRRHGRVLAER